MSNDMKLLILVNNIVHFVEYFRRKLKAQPTVKKERMLVLSKPFNQTFSSNYASEMRDMLLHSYEVLSDQSHIK